MIQGSRARLQYFGRFLYFILHIITTIGHKKVFLDLHSRGYLKAKGDTDSNGNFFESQIVLHKESLSQAGLGAPDPADLID